MEKPLSILLVRGESAEGEVLANRIAGCEDLRLAGVTDSDETALALLREREPDVLLLDGRLHLGAGGGIRLLRAWRASGLPSRPFILVTTTGTDGVFQDVARDYGADLVLNKDSAAYSNDLAVDLLRVMSDTIRRRSTTRPAESPGERQRRLTTRICAELDRVGVSSKLVGYRYLMLAIRRVVQDPPDNLCAAVAEETGRSKASVERAMKSAIDHAWRNADGDALRNYTARVDPGRGTPTVSEFVRYYAGKLRLEYD